MYELIIKADFCGAHKLNGYKGKCEDIHGHNWKVEASFEANALNNIGIAGDFRILKSKLRATLKKFDHKDLNRLDFFKSKNPSAENIAEYIYKKLQHSIIKDKNLSLRSVSVWESENTCARYYIL